MDGTYGIHGAIANDGQTPASERAQHPHQILGHHCYFRLKVRVFRALASMERAHDERVPCEARMAHVGADRVGGEQGPAADALRKNLDCRKWTPESSADARSRC